MLDCIMVSGGIGGSPPVPLVEFEFPAKTDVPEDDTAGEAALSALVNELAGLVSEAGIEVNLELALLVLPLLLLDLVLFLALVSLLEFAFESLAWAFCCLHFALRFLNQT